MGHYLTHLWPWRAKWRACVGFREVSTRACLIVPNSISSSPIVCQIISNHTSAQAQIMFSHGFDCLWSAVIVQPDRLPFMRFMQARG